MQPKPLQYRKYFEEEKPVVAIEGRCAARTILPLRHHARARCAGLWPHAFAH